MEIESGVVSFQGKKGKVSGFLAKPTLAGTKNAIIVVQEWWGINDFVKNVTKNFAKQGYVALAVDLYDGKVTKNGQEASAMMYSLSIEKAMHHLSAGYNYLKNLGVKKIGTVGFCMGGRIALIFAATEKLDAAVDFYGAQIELQFSYVKNLSCPIFCIFGGKDPSISEDEINELRREFIRNNKEYKIETYPNATHAFFNDTRPEVYNKEAANDVWPKVVEFFNKNLK